MTDPWIIVSWVGAICTALAIIGVTIAVLVSLVNKPGKGKTTKIQ